MSDDELLRRPIGWWLKEADARLDGAFDEVLAGRDVCRRDWQVLAFLARSPASHDEVVRSLASFDPADAVEAVVDALRGRGWIEESAGVLHLSARGLIEQQALSPLVDGVRRQVAAALPAGQYVELVRLLARLAAALPDPGHRD